MSNKRLRRQRRFASSRSGREAGPEQSLWRENLQSRRCLEPKSKEGSHKERLAVVQSQAATRKYSPEVLGRPGSSPHSTASPCSPSKELGQTPRPPTVERLRRLNSIFYS